MKLKKILGIMTSLLLSCFMLSACNMDSSDTSTESYCTHLTGGNYIVGTDIPIGKYDLTALEGRSIVYTDDFNEGGLYANMCQEETEYCVKHIHNVNLKEGQRLTIEGNLTLELKSDSAQTNNMTPREVEGKECELERGFFQSGKDFEPGVYDITVLDGTDFIYSDNLMKGGIHCGFSVNEEPDYPDYVQTQKNIELPEGIFLNIGLLKVKLTPSTGDPLPEFSPIDTGDEEVNSDNETLQTIDVAKKELNYDTLSGVQEAIYDSVWTRETEEGEKGIFFDRLGAMTAGTFIWEKQKMSDDSVWTSYEIIDKNTLRIYDANSNETVDYPITFEGDILTINGETYTRQDYSAYIRWLDYAHDERFAPGYTLEMIENHREKIERENAMYQ